MNVSKVMDGFNGQYTFGHVEPSNIFRKHVVFHQHSHQISTREELHDEIQIERVLERVEQLNNPRRCRFRKDISFRAYVSQLGEF